MANATFPQTRWTLVLSAKNGDAEQSKKAFDELALAYWKPVYAFLRRKGDDHEEAQDKTQTFFTHLLKGDFLRNLQPEGGRFRNFLLVSLRHKLINEHHRVINRKERAEVPIEPWNEAEVSEESFHSTLASPEAAFDRSWALELFARTMDRLQSRWGKRPALFAELRYTIESPGNAAKYADIGSRLGMSSGAVGKAAHDLRKQFVQQIRQEIRDTVASDDDIEEELRYLVKLLQA